jgi:Ca2+:H+ antiporter
MKILCSHSILQHHLTLMICPNIELQDSSESSSTNSDDGDADNTVIRFASAVIWLIGMAVVIAILSNYVVTTIEV